MAFGFSPKHEEEVELTIISESRFYAVAVVAAEELGWKISLYTPDGFVAYTKFSLTSYGEEFKVHIKDGKVYLKSECTGSQLYDWGKNKENIEDFKLRFNKVKKGMSEAEMDERFSQLKENFVGAEDVQLNETPLSSKEKASDFFSLFIPVEGYYITPILVLLNILIFIVMVATGVSVMAPDGESLVQWGANFRPSTIDGEWWRLITSCFIHIGIFHLLMNMYALLYIGLLLEPLLGKERFLTAFLLSGIVGSTVSFYWHDLTISAGASGAIFGMYGVFLAMLTTNLIEKTARKALLTSIAVFVGYNLLNGMKGGIDNAAHIGGLISGLVIGYSFIPSIKNPENKSYGRVTIIALSVAVMTLVAVVLSTTDNSDYAEYDKRIQEFISLEQQGLNIFNLPEGTSDEQYLNELEGVSIYSFEEAAKLVRELDELDLPVHVHHKNTKLIKYCELRVASLETMYKAISEQTTIYDKEIEDYNLKIDSVISLLESP